MQSAPRRALSLLIAPTSGIGLLVRFTLGVFASLGLGWLVSRGLNWNEVLNAFREVPLGAVVFATLVFLLSNLCRAFRWWLLFSKERISITRLFIVENIGLGLNNLLPVRIAGEAIQFAILTLKDGIGGGTTIATLGMTRVMDIWATTLLLALGLVLVPDAGQFTRYAVGGLVFSMLLLALIRLLAWGSRGLSSVSRVPMLTTLATSVAEMEDRKGRLAASLAVSLGQWVVLGLSGWILALGMDIPVSLPQVVLVMLLTILFATSVPSLPGAIGTFEAAMIYAMRFFDVDKDVSFLYALIMHALLFLPPTIIAAAFLPREGIGSLRELQSWSQNWRGNSTTEQA
jgi:uncharacterized protein (TIRG00374 family)